MIICVLILCKGCNSRKMREDEEESRDDRCKSEGRTSKRKTREDEEDESRRMAANLMVVT
ncbi:unnamed protein product [Thlaspi arvense]|uniref:Uncharacterized protein n=1 Tax=Thlaspi arvense TaxID=13288 RepID=A0AAU9S7L6_THLAR|nr:unnamed protein product [Thlaspi arvense]